MNRSNLGHRQETVIQANCVGSSTIGIEVVAHVVEEEVAEVGEEVVVGEVMASSSRESALPKCQQRPPNECRREWLQGTLRPPNGVQE